MQRTFGRALVVGVAALAVGAGCGSSHETQRSARAPRTGTSRAALTTTEVSTTTTTSASMPASTGTNAPAVTRATPITPSSAVMRLTTARCDREAACSHVGTGRMFGDRDACVNEIGHAVVTTLSADDCPVGIDPDRLEACASEVQAASCDGADGAKDDTLGVEHLASCSRERLCGGAF